MANPEPPTHADVDTTCGDCAEGRCHGGSGPCGCARHDASTRPVPVFVPRVFISPYGSVAVEEEPRGEDKYRIVRVGRDVLSVTMCDQRAQVVMPGEWLHRLHFQEMVRRGY